MADTPNPTGSSRRRSTPISAERATPTDAPSQSPTEKVLTVLRTPPTNAHVLRGFGPLAVAVILALAAITMAPSIAPERIVTEGGGGVATGVPLAGGPRDETSSGTGGATPGQGATVTTLAPGATPTGSGSGSDSGATPTAGGGESTSGSAPAAAGGVQACADRALQVPSDPYSPPCLAFSGDNGGATSQGVTEDEILVTIRVLEGPTAAELFADISGQSVETSPEAVENTIHALGEYFSDKFQFYGRSLRFQFFDGQGSGADELLGGGKEGALADAVRAGEFEPFADMSAITTPYADAIARQQIIGFGAPYPSQEWYVERRPYAWSLFPDGTTVSEAAVSGLVARLSGQQNADYAGGDLAGTPRKFGLVAPDNAEYKGSVDRFAQRMNEAGYSFEASLRYKLDINSMPNQASNIIAQLKDAGATTIVCACDPVMLALGMAPKANEQDYEPEWLTGGLAFMDQDIVAQLVDKRQWRHAFGVAFNAESEPQGQSFPYAAFKAMRPRDEPAFGVEEVYYQMYMLALGIHLAGPNLTPETFEAGMFSYPGGSGPRGFWGFGPGDYTPTDDVREIWWNPDAISPQNNKPGRWEEIDGGKRYFPGQFPNEPAPFFQGS